MLTCHAAADVIMVVFPGKVRDKLKKWLDKSRNLLISKPHTSNHKKFDIETKMQVCPFTILFWYA